MRAHKRGNSQNRNEEMLFASFCCCLCGNKSACLQQDAGKSPAFTTYDHFLTYLPNLPQDKIFLSSAQHRPGGKLKIETQFLVLTNCCEMLVSSPPPGIKTTSTTFILCHCPLNRMQSGSLQQWNSLPASWHDARLDQKHLFTLLMNQLYVTRAQGLQGHKGSCGEGGQSVYAKGFGFPTGAWHTATAIAPVLSQMTDMQSVRAAGQLVYN